MSCADILLPLDVEVDYLKQHVALLTDEPNDLLKLLLAKTCIRISDMLSPIQVTNLCRPSMGCPPSWRSQSFRGRLFS